MKAILIAVLALGLCGCQGLKQAAVQQPAPGTMAAGNWEFVLQKSDTQNIYVESNIANTGTAGAYSDHGGNSALFSLDDSIYFTDPAAGGGYQAGAAVSGFTLSINPQLGVSGTLNLASGLPIRFTGMVDASGMTMSGTFDDGSGDTAPFSASTTPTLGGTYNAPAGLATESISGGIISETSQFGSGNYALTSPFGNFAALLSDVPVGGDGSVVFWNNTGVCTGKQCSVWFNASTHTLWVFVNDPDSGTGTVISVLHPPA